MATVAKIFRKPKSRAQKNMPPWDMPVFLPFLYVPKGPQPKIQRKKIREWEKIFFWEFVLFSSWVLCRPPYDLLRLPAASTPLPRSLEQPCTLRLCIRSCLAGPPSDPLLLWTSGGEQKCDEKIWKKWEKITFCKLVLFSSWVVLHIVNQVVVFSQNNLVASIPPRCP